MKQQSETTVGSPFAIANIRYFIAFRVFFNARFYYPVFTILFLDYGLTIEQFAILNSVWAATIVLAEVPSGALADVIGRKQLLMATAVLMVGEMLLLSFVPLQNISIVFWAFLINRVLSGLAEAMASGADEALAYDTLVEQGDKDDWPAVLSVSMRIRSFASVITMGTGALLYDPVFINRALDMLGSSLTVSQQVSMRFPVYLTLVLSLLACASVLLMTETTGSGSASNRPTLLTGRLAEAARMTLRAGIWIVQTPFALVIILFAMIYDHVLRMVITMTSQYLRLIHLPEASFGIIGAAMAVLGIFIPRIAEKMVARYTPMQNTLWLAGMTIIALGGTALFIPYFGLFFLLFVSGGLMITSFFASHYLNRITASHQRATVLSFKGLAFNLAYGLIGIAFAGLIAGIRRQKESFHPEWSQALIENASFESAVVWFTPYTIALLIASVIFSIHALRATDLHRRKG